MVPPRLVPTGNGPERVEVMPTACPNGHDLGAGAVRIGFLPCLCCHPDSGHRTYRRAACDAMIYDPPHTDPSKATGVERGR